MFNWGKQIISVITTNILTVLLVLTPIVIMLRQDLREIVEVRWVTPLVQLKRLMMIFYI